VVTFFDVLNELMAAEVPLVTVTVVDTMGSAPQDRGAKMIVTAEGLRHGTVGGGKVETKAIAEAQRMLRGELADTTHFVAVEPQQRRRHDLRRHREALLRIAQRRPLEDRGFRRWTCCERPRQRCSSTSIATSPCIDPREEWLAKLPSSPKLTAVLTSDMPSMVATMPDDAFVVLMTMGHTTDKPILIEILRTRTFPYLGVIGSDAKAVILRRDVEEAGLPEEAQHAFHCPIGLEIGSSNPYEIGVSVIAQMIQTRDSGRAV
jgi:xanthine dehydrogenase accessory factor